MEQDQSAFFKFIYKGAEFLIEILKKKKISLCRLLDPISSLVSLQRHELKFQYLDKEIFSINPASPLHGFIEVHNDSEGPDSQKLKICRFLIESEDRKETWAVSRKGNKILHFLLNLREDEEYKEVFKREFSVFHKGEKIEIDTQLERFENYSEFVIRFVEVTDRISFKVISFGYETINCEYNASCKWTTLKINLELFFGFIIGNSKIYVNKDKFENFTENLRFNLMINAEAEVCIMSESGGANEDFKNEIEPNPNAPDFRTISAGLNIKCICSVEDCDLSKEYFIIMKGFEESSLEKMKEEIRCRGKLELTKREDQGKAQAEVPCGASVLIRAFGIYKCKLKITRIDNSGNIFIDNHENYSENYISFDYYLRKYKNSKDIIFTPIK